MKTTALPLAVLALFIGCNSEVKQEQANQTQQAQVKPVDPLALFKQKVQKGIELARKDGGQNISGAFELKRINGNFWCTCLPRSELL